jgi:NADH-quinone oxidoreductase subunit J
MTAAVVAALAARGAAAPSFASWHGKEALFVALGVLAVASGVLVVTVRNVVHAALWLVVALGALAGCYLVLTAELVAWVQVLVYIGAVVVMLLFATMLTRARIGRTPDLDSGNRAVAAVVALATAAILVFCVADAFSGAYVDLDRVAAEARGSAAANGAAIFRNWVLPFEVVSVLLLAALIGAIVLVRHDPRSSRSAASASTRGATDDLPAEPVSRR